MADWSVPVVTSTYLNVLAYLKDRDVDAVTLFKSAGTNLPTGAIRWNRSLLKFEEWDGAAWGASVISIAGGGTGSTTAAGARTALGLGTMAVQNASAVAITGGTILDITALDMKGHQTYDSDNSYDIGADASRPRNVYIKTGLVIPVGVDKFVT